MLKKRFRDKRYAELMQKSKQVNWRKYYLLEELDCDKGFVRVRAKEDSGLAPYQIIGE